MKVRLITEGNYPVVRGGVTRWCELLIRGLPQHTWSITALGVEPDPARPGHAEVRHVTAADLSAAHAWWGRRSDLPAEVATHLFSPVPNPAGFARTLAACADEPGLSRALRSPATRKQVRAVAARHVGAAADPDGAAMSLAMDRTTEVVLAAMHRPDPVDVQVVACAGTAVVPAAVSNLIDATPFLLVEHGVYVREAYLRTIGEDVSPAARLVVRRAALNLARLGYHLAARVAGVSDANRQWSVALGADPETTEVIHNGVELPATRPSLPATSTVGMIGRIDPFKGVDTFVRAAATVASANDTARFVHVGPTESCHRDYATSCREMAGALGLSDRLRFVGEVDDIGPELANMDVVVVPSRTEGLPYALLEAMAAGRPVVASAVGGVPELLGGAGILVDPDDPDALSAEMLALLADPARAAEVGAACAERVSTSYLLGESLERMDRAMHRATQRLGVMA